MTFNNDRRWPGGWIPPDPLPGSEQQLVDLALQASARSKHDEAIQLLQEALKVAPRNATGIYLLAAEYAETGKRELACRELARAVEFDPGLHTARFQLGLLRLTLGQLHSGLEALRPLTALPSQHFLCCFARGLEYLCCGDIVHCKKWLEEGIKQNRQSGALNENMQKILGKVESLLATSGPDALNPGVWTGEKGSGMGRREGPRRSDDD